jgi:hypothetical protein
MARTRPGSRPAPEPVTRHTWHLVPAAPSCWAGSPNRGCCVRARRPSGGVSAFAAADRSIACRNARERGAGGRSADANRALASARRGQRATAQGRVAGGTGARGCAPARAGSGARGSCCNRTRGQDDPCAGRGRRARRGLPRAVPTAAATRATAAVPQTFEDSGRRAATAGTSSLDREPDPSAAGPVAAGARPRARVCDRGPRARSCGGGARARVCDRGPRARSCGGGARAPSPGDDCARARCPGGDHA